MKMVRYLLSLVLIFTIIFAALGGYAWFFLNPTPPDRQLFVNATVLTMDGNNQIAEALLVEKDQIVAAGSEAALLKLADDKADIIDLEGKTLLPGFIKTHDHCAANAFSLKLLSDRVNSNLVNGITTVKTPVKSTTEYQPLSTLVQFGIIPLRMVIRPSGVLRKKLENGKIQPVNSERVITLTETELTWNIFHDNCLVPEEPLTLINKRLQKRLKEQKLSDDEKQVIITQSLRDMTINAARLAMQGKILGSLEQGKYADFVVLSDNPLLYTDMLEKIHVDQTWIGGILRFNRHEFSPDDDRLPAVESQ